jgi:hypothetical protein
MISLTKLARHVVKMQSLGCSNASKACHAASYSS